MQPCVGRRQCSPRQVYPFVWWPRNKSFFSASPRTGTVVQQCSCDVALPRPLFAARGFARRANLREPERLKFSKSWAILLSPLTFPTSFQLQSSTPALHYSLASMSAKSEEEALAAELSSCMLAHYKYCAAGVLLGLPLSIHKKSYWPVTMAAVAGTAVDFKEASVNCAPQREAFMAYIARKGAEGPAKREQGKPAESSTDGSAKTLSEDTWPVDQQQGWPEKGWEQNFDANGDGRESGREDQKRW